MKKDVVEDTKLYYLNRLNKEIYYIDNFFKSTDTIKKELLKSYKILKEESDVSEFNYIIKEDLKEELKAEHLQSIDDIKEEYMQSIMENIVHEQIKKELLKTIENIKKINLPTTVAFLDMFKDLIIEEHAKDTDRLLKEVVSDIIAKELNL